MRRNNGEKRDYRNRDGYSRKKHSRNFRNSNERNDHPRRNSNNSRTYSRDNNNNNRKRYNRDRDRNGYKRMFKSSYEPYERKQKYIGNWRETFEKDYLNEKKKEISVDNAMKELGKSLIENKSCNTFTFEPGERIHKTKANTVKSIENEIPSVPKEAINQSNSTQKFNELPYSVDFVDNLLKVDINKIDDTEKLKEMKQKLDDLSLFCQSLSVKINGRINSLLSEKLEDIALCCVCMEEKVNIVFNCGHTCCEKCSNKLENCPKCREKIKNKIKMYM